MKKTILITMLMSVVFAQSDCNKSNWQEYYNSDGKDMSECDLRDANLRDADLRDADLRDADLRDADLRDADLTGANFSRANFSRANFSRADLRGANLSYAILTDVISTDIKGVPRSLPDGWSLVDKALIKDKWGSSTPPDDMMTDGDDPKFEDIDADSDGCISEDEFNAFQEVRKAQFQQEN